MENIGQRLSREPPGLTIRGAVLLAALWAGAQLGAAERPEDRWNLADLYPSVKAWADDAARLEAQLKAFSACRGHLGKSAHRLRTCLDAHADLSKRYDRLKVYASELFAEDTGAPESLELNEKARSLGTQRDELTSFLKPEILRVGKSRIERFYAQEPLLSVYRQPLDRILRAAPHTLDTGGENIVATFGLSKDAAGSTYRILTNAELLWPTIRLSDGREVKLDQSAYTEYRAAPDRDDRKKVFDAFWGTWKQFERTFGVTFHESLKKDAVYTKIRKYPDTLSRTLDRERLPASVYATLIAETNKNLPTLHRYLGLRGKLLAIKGEMHYYDIYPRLVSSKRKYPIDEARKMMLESVKPLGEFNEALLLEHVLRNATNDDERLLYLGSALETLRGTFFRQAMFAEFEREVHARVDRGEPLSGDKLTRIYGEILRRYHGDQEGVMKIDDAYTVEWAYIPHFYQPFYVFQYATSIAASSLLADAVLKGEPGTRERYLKLLAAGGSDYPYELVKAAGVDLASPAPYRAVVARMNRIMDEIEAIQARRAGR